MSDPVTNMQIEDVLSSIRKLVSDEVRAQTRPKVLQAAETKRDQTPARRGPEMLVLTPDHRISAQSDSPEADDAEAEHSALHDEAIWAERGAEPAGASGTEFDIESFSRNLLDDDDA